MRAYGALLLAFGMAFGCSSDDGGAPVNLVGSYAGTFTNGMSSCPGTWNTGAVTNGSLNVAESGTDLQFQAQGAIAVGFLAAFGVASFGGKALGSHADGTIVGSVKSAEGACSYTWKGVLSGDLASDKLTGSLTLTPETNNDPDCTSKGVIGCSRSLTFDISRPAMP